MKENLNFSGGKLWSYQIEDDSDEGDFHDDNENDDEESEEEKKGEEDQSVHDKNEKLEMIKDANNSDVPSQNDLPVDPIIQSPKPSQDVQRATVNPSSPTTITQRPNIDLVDPGDVVGGIQPNNDLPNNTMNEMVKKK